MGHVITRFVLVQKSQQNPNPFEILDMEESPTEGMLPGNQSSNITQAYSTYIGHLNVQSRFGSWER